MQPLLKNQEERKEHRWCKDCLQMPPNHAEDCHWLKERTPKPWKKHSNKSNRLPEEDNDGE